MRVTLATNVYVSAFQFGGPPQQVLQLMLDGDLEVAVSGYIVNETLETLRDKFGWAQDALARVRDTIEWNARVVRPVESLNVIEEDPDDNRILECACTAESQAIVTGDKDLLRLGEFRGIPILTVRSILTRIQQID